MATSVRFCDQCKLNVYNLSELTKAEAERLIGNAEGRLCVRYYRRRDGSILTQNCPVGLRALKRRMTRIANAIGSTVLSFFAGLGAYGLFARTEISNPRPQPLMGAIAVEQPHPRLADPKPQVIKGQLEMGRVQVRPIRKR